MVLNVLTNFSDFNLRGRLVNPHLTPENQSFTIENQVSKILMRDWGSLRETNRSWEERSFP